MPVPTDPGSLESSFGSYCLLQYLSLGYAGVSAGFFKAVLPFTDGADLCQYICIADICQDKKDKKEQEKVESRPEKRHDGRKNRKERPKMSKPLIAVMGAHKLSVLYNENPVPSAALNETYANAVTRAGGIPVILPPYADDADLFRVLSLCSGLLLPGGEDVDPRYFGEDPSPKLGRITGYYDRAWLAALKYAEEKKMPVLGICRGHQLANLGFGGTLYQDLSDYPGKTILHGQHQDRTYPVHKVSIVPESWLAQILGFTEVYTNTMHHQCVKDPGAGLIVSARTGDGVIEGLETADGSMIFVQWHPEELQDTVPCMRELFADLVKKAERFAGNGSEGGE